MTGSPGGPTALAGLAASGRDDGPAIGADAIVVAAGSSSRMAGIDKLATPIGDRPLLAWSVGALAAAPEVDRIVVVVAGGAVDGVRSATWLPAKVVAVVAGGDRRQDSVAAGFAALELLGEPVDDRVVLVHDGARPAVSPELVGAVARAAAVHGAAIPVVPIVETVKRLDGEWVGATVDRRELGAAQTPQGVRRGLLVEAFGRVSEAANAVWTDEAALLEACRIPVHAIPGDPTNLKVTTPDDLGRAELVLLGARPTRFGYGQDSHPFGPGEPLALGGIAIDGAPRLRGHSDGDVALHALADALLGAAGLGDLGRIFPAGPATPRGIASGELVQEVVRRLAANGLRPAQVDLTIVAARPRLGDRLDGMRSAIADLLGLATDRVNVKASSGNLAGVEGAGRGIAAQAVATVEPIR